MEKNKFNPLKLFIIVLALFLFPFLFVAIFALVFHEPEKPFQPPENPFRYCKELERDCQNSFCKYHSLCQWFVSDIKNCEIYDCGQTYGLLIKNSEDRLLTKIYNKPNTREIEKNISSCLGTLKTISQKCENNTQKLTLQVKNSADCPAEAFLYRQNDVWQAAVFTALEPELYLLNIPFCSDTLEIKAVGKKGIVIGEIIK